jgi:hypothetical protein
MELKINIIFSLHAPALTILGIQLLPIVAILPGCTNDAHVVLIWLLFAGIHVCIYRTEQNIIVIGVKSIYKGLLPKQHIKYKTKETVNCNSNMFCAGWSLTVWYVHQVIFALWEDKINFCSPVCEDRCSGSICILHFSMHWPPLQKQQPT